MAYYAVEVLNTNNGKRRELPFRFSSQWEAQGKTLELTRHTPMKFFIVKLVPAA